MRLNQLKWYLRSVANAVLDYQMHCTNMTDEEAVQFLMRRAFQSEAEAILKVIRAKQSSCQLSTYFVGRMAFQRLRRHFQTELAGNLRWAAIMRRCWRMARYRSLPAGTRCGAVEAAAMKGLSLRWSKWN